MRALGAGGFGSVWLARDETLGVDVAVKEVRLPPAGTAAERAELLERTRREARHAARLRDHPHVVGVHDVVLDGGAPWTVMQLIVGRSLHERIAADGPLPVPEAVRVATAVLLPSAVPALFAAALPLKRCCPGGAAPSWSVPT